MKRTLVLLVLPLAILMLSAAGVVAQPDEASINACNILKSPKAYALSAAGETALKIKCGLMPAVAQKGAPGAVSGPEGVQAPIDPSQLGGQINLGVDVLVNNRAGDVYSHITQSETTVANQGNTVLVGFNDSGSYIPGTRDSFTGWARSTDNGATFTDMGAVPPGGQAAEGIWGDPVIAPGLQSNVFYFSNLGDATADMTSIIAVTRSSDGGLTFPGANNVNASPGALFDDFQDKEWMATDVGRNGATGNIYVCWTNFVGNGDMQIMFSRSTDGGLTFGSVQGISELIPITDPRIAQGCSVDVSPVDGKVYVAWSEWHYSTMVGQIRIRRSDNLGVSFNPTVNVGPLTTPYNSTARTNCGRPALNGNIRHATFPSIAVGGNGHINVVWNSVTGTTPTTSPEIYFSHSGDLGATWAARMQINDVSTSDQFFPSVDVASNGRIKAIFYDRRNDAANLMIDVYEAYSDNGGAAWTNARVTDVSFGVPPLSPNFDTYIARCYMGDYNDIQASGNDFLMAWGDNRLAAPGGGGHPDPDIRFDKEGVVQPTPPAAPFYRSAARVGTNQVRLIWGDTSTNEEAFVILRGFVDEALSVVGVVAPNTTTWTDTEAPTGLQAYLLVSYNAAGLGIGLQAGALSTLGSPTAGADKAAPASIDAPNIPGAEALLSQPKTTAAPVAPCYRLAARIAASSVQLTWTDRSTNEEAFAIVRGTLPGPFTVVGIANPDATTFTDTSAPAATVQYLVVAVHTVEGLGIGIQACAP